jgi:hypothetical protein
MKFRITHGVHDGVVVEGATAAGNAVDVMLAAGLTNILVTKEETPVSVTQVDRESGDVPPEAICRLLFDVTALRPA